MEPKVLPRKFMDRSEKITSIRKKRNLRNCGMTHSTETRFAMVSCQQVLQILGEGTTFIINKYYTLNNLSHKSIFVINLLRKEALCQV